VDPSRILVPVDFSDCSRLLVAEAITLATRLNATLSLLHVVQPPDGLTANTPIQPDTTAVGTTIGAYLMNAAWDRVPALLDMTRSAGVKAEAHVLLGPVATTIIEQSEAGSYGMIMMGTHGRSGLSRVLMGSVAEQVTRRSRLPVLTVRTQHRADCDAGSCQWCASQVMPRDVGAELTGGVQLEDPELPG